MKTLAVSSSVVPCQEYFGLSGLVLEMGKPSRPSQMADRDAEGECRGQLVLEPSTSLRETEYRPSRSTPRRCALEAHQEGEPAI